MEKIILLRIQSLENGKHEEEFCDISYKFAQQIK